MISEPWVFHKKFLFGITDSATATEKGVPCIPVFSMHSYDLVHSTEQALVKVTFELLAMLTPG